jgi:putative cardiolipin synthase
MILGLQGHRLGSWVLASAALLAGCSARVDWQHPRVPSNAFESPASTSIGALFEPAAREHPGKSGFLLVQHGRDAFMARLSMADLAEKTLDAQYYIWSPDTTGRILAERLVRAANRGVRVRVLIDDMYMTADRDVNFAILDAHANIEIRVFNPATRRGARGASFLGDFERLNRRMHNKIFVIDNAVAVVGGRNIGDVYFGVKKDVNYSDLDVMAAGPIVGEVSTSFDAFWNSEWAVPVGAFVEALPAERDPETLRAEFAAEIAAAGYPYPLDETTEQLRARLVRFRDQFVWAPGHVLVDDPAKVVTKSDTGIVREAISRRITEVSKELFISSAYLVLPERPVDRIRELCSRGVTVRILTNSAATNDVLPAHAGYARTRKKLLDAGAELYELRPDTKLQRRWSVLAGQSSASLHVKSVLFDRESVFIGSFNLDPRSTALNTEIGVMIDSPEIAARVGEFFDESILPESAFRVTLDEDHDLLWTARDDGEPVTFRKDPRTSAWYRFVAGVVGLLPIQSQL